MPFSPKMSHYRHKLKRHKKIRSPATKPRKKSPKCLDPVRGKLIFMLQTMSKYILKFLDKFSFCKKLKGFFRLSFSCSPNVDKQVDSVKEFRQLQIKNVSVYCCVVWHPKSPSPQAHALNSVLPSGGQGPVSNWSSRRHSQQESCRSHICSMLEPFQLKLLI